MVARQWPLRPTASFCLPHKARRHHASVPVSQRTLLPELQRWVLALLPPEPSPCAGCVLWPRRLLGQRRSSSRHGCARSGQVVGHMSAFIGRRGAWHSDLPRANIEDSSTVRATESRGSRHVLRALCLLCTNTHWAHSLGCTCNGRARTKHAQ